MSFSLSEIEAILWEAILEIQIMSGEEHQAVDGNTRPIGDLSGFDSLRGIEATFELESKLGVEFNTKANSVNLFVSVDSGRALTVNEIAERMYKSINSK